MPLDFPTNPVDGQVYDGFIWVDALDAWRRLPADPSIPLGLLEDVTLTTPTIDEVLKYDGTQWVNGPDEGGKILQVVQGSHSGEVTSTSTTFVDTGLSATITPLLTTSKILVLVSQSVNVNLNTNSTIEAQIRLMRGSTQVALYNGVRSTIGNAAFGLSAQTYFSFLDSPSTTSATTYKTQLARNLIGGAGDVRSGQMVRDNFITLLEVAG